MTNPDALTRTLDTSSDLGWPEGQKPNSNGDLPESSRTALTAAQIMAAPPDCREEWVEVPEWGGWLKLRSPTALAAASIKSAGVVLDAETETANLDMAAMERAQVLHGVVEPALTPEQVAEMQKRFGPSFGKVVAKLDELAGPLSAKDGEEKLRKAAEHTFRAG